MGTPSPGSDFPNQIDDVLAFPGLFRGMLDAAREITDEVMLAAAGVRAAEIQ